MAPGEMLSMPRIDVLLPVYDVEPYVGEALNSMRLSDLYGD